MKARTSEWLKEQLMMAGYAQKSFPRWVRKIMARTSFHKAWLSGYTGAFLLPVLERN